MSDLLRGTSAAAIKPQTMPCQQSGCPKTTTVRCTMCTAAFCENHLYRPTGGLVGERIANCKPCAKSSFDQEFMATVQSALSLLFGLGLKGVTLHTPGGKTAYYDCPDVEKAVAGIPAGIVKAG